MCTRHVTALWKIRQFRRGEKAIDKRPTDFELRHLNGSVFVLWFAPFKMNSMNAHPLSSSSTFKSKMLIYILIFLVCLICFSCHSQQQNIDVFRTVLEKSKLFDFDGLCKLWIGPKLIVFLFRPDDVELILSSHVYIDKSAEYDFFKPWLGEGLLISTGKCQTSGSIHEYEQRPGQKIFLCFIK